MKNKMFISFVICSFVLSACFGPSPVLSIQQSQDNGFVFAEVQNQSVEVQPAVITEPVVSDQDAHSDAEHHSDVDLTHLEVGDGRYSTSPQFGYVYTCMT